MLTLQDLARSLRSVYHNLGALCGKSEELPCATLQDAVERYTTAYERMPSRETIRKMVKEYQLPPRIEVHYPEWRLFSTIESECEMRVIALDTWYAVVAFAEACEIDTKCPEWKEVVS